METFIWHIPLRRRSTYWLPNAVFSSKKMKEGSHPSSRDLWEIILGCSHMASHISEQKLLSGAFAQIPLITEAQQAHVGRRSQSSLTNGKNKARRRGTLGKYSVAKQADGRSFPPQNSIKCWAEQCCLEFQCWEVETGGWLRLSGQWV